MSKIYTNCPTCGGLCFYPSDNFRDAQIRINALAFSDMEQALKYSLDRIIYLEQLMDSRDKQDLLGILTADDLWKAFLIKARGFQLIKWSDIFSSRYNITDYK